jgi:putative two-component system response regulator
MEANQEASLILIVDDEPTGRRALESLLLGQGFTLAFAAGGLEAIELARHVEPDLILLDVMMPGMDGRECLRRLRMDPRLAEIPVVMVSALDDRASRVAGLEAGADGYVAKPFERSELRAQIHTILRLNRYRKLHRALQLLQQAYDETLEGWVRAIDLREHELEGHSQRVTSKTDELARFMGVDEAQLVHIHRGALLHDVGKIAIPDAILNKPGPLTAEEWIIMRQHPEHGRSLLEPIAYLRPAIDIPLCHHERWDGQGYPRGLSREQIPPAARIFSVVDVWDALITDRSYRRAWPAARVRRHILDNSGKAFDPAVASAFLTMPGMWEGRETDFRWVVKPPLTTPGSSASPTTLAEVGCASGASLGEVPLSDWRPSL